MSAKCSSYPEMRRRLPLIVEAYKAANGDAFTHELVEGSHHVHLNHPERVMEIIERFLQQGEEGKNGNL